MPTIWRLKFRGAKLDPFHLFSSPNLFSSFFLHFYFRPLEFDPTKYGSSAAQTKNIPFPAISEITRFWHGPASSAVALGSWNEIDEENLYDFSFLSLLIISIFKSFVRWGTFQFQTGSSCLDYIDYFPESDKPFGQSSKWTNCGHGKDGGSREFQEMVIN